MIGKWHQVTINLSHTIPHLYMQQPGYPNAMENNEASRNHGFTGFPVYRWQPIRHIADAIEGRALDNFFIGPMDERCIHPSCQLAILEGWRIFSQKCSPEKNSNHSCFIIISCFFPLVSCSHLPHQPVFFQASGDSSSLWSHDHRCWHFYWSCLSQADSQLLTFSWSFRSDMTWLQGLIPKQHQVRKQW